MPTGKSIILPYVPSAPPGGIRPEDFTRAAWDEFYRIQRALIDLDRPAASSLSCSESVSIQAGVVYDRLFNENVTTIFEQPGGQTDTATGIWTCPQEGLYYSSSEVNAPAFPTASVKDYTMTLRTTLVPISGPNVVKIAVVVVPDTLPLRLVGIVLLALNRGDQIYQDVDLTHSTAVGAVTVKASREIIRQSGIR